MEKLIKRLSESCKKTDPSLDLESWNQEKQSHFAEVSRLALFEAVEEGTCLFCKGRKVMTYESGVVPCLHCTEKSP